MPVLLSELFPGGGGTQTLTEFQRHPPGGGRDQETLDLTLSVHDIQQVLSWLGEGELDMLIPKFT